MESTSHSQPVRALVWDENPPHAPRELYPHSINGAIAEGLNQMSDGHIVATTANIDDADQGVSEDVLTNTDVLLWWDHARQKEFSDDNAERVRTAVHERGLGLILLHSACLSKVFNRVLDAPGFLKGGWRMLEEGEREEITVCAPRHPIARGIEDFVIEREEMYGSPLCAPPFHTLIFQSYFPHGGEYFPCGFTLSVGRGINPEFTNGPGEGIGQGEGAGRVFYFRPGHESVPTYLNPTVRRIIANGVLWCARRA